VPDSKAKGNKGEREVVDLFEGWGYRCTRAKQGGGSDKGPDVLAVGPIVDFAIESKRYKASWTCVRPGLEQAEAWVCSRDARTPDGWTWPDLYTLPVVRLKHDRKDGLMIMKEEAFGRLLDILERSRKQCHRLDEEVGALREANRELHRKLQRVY